MGTVFDMRLMNLNRRLAKLDRLTALVLYKINEEEWKEIQEQEAQRKREVARCRKEVEKQYAKLRKGTKEERKYRRTASQQRWRPKNEVKRSK